MIKPVVSFLCVSYLCGLFTLAAADCSQLQQVFTVSETDPNGTELFNLTYSGSTPLNFTVKNDSGLSQTQLDALRNHFFHLEQNSTYAAMSLKQTLDLELLQSDFHRTIETIVLRVVCADTTYEATIRITAVNEFDPVFNKAPYNISIPESFKPNDSTVFDFSIGVEDKDIPPPPVFFYEIHKFLIPDHDGRHYFYFPATTQGRLVVLNTLDYDSLDPHKEFSINVSVADGNKGTVRRSAFTTLTIKITDADDQKPYFDYPNCGNPCVAPPYEAVIQDYHVGSLIIQPRAIAAKDDDTLGTRLLFSIQGNDYGMFEINPFTGVVLQTKSVVDSGQQNSVFRLIIQVSKDIPLDLSAIAILSVRVAGRQPNTTDSVIPPRESEDSRSSSSSLLIPVIILGILLAILIAAVILVFVLMRRKQRQMMISPENDKSEPQTEEEEIHDTDRSQEYNNMADMNEKLMFGKGKTTRAVATEDMYPVPTERAGQLPPLPLRDSATETTEIRKKKRSRKRNKNKEPEIFDGTREYNMGLDPEFFESSDKSRVKRSQRSKKADSSLPINVPNDQPPEDDYDHVMHM